MRRHAFPILAGLFIVFAPASNALAAPPIGISAFTGYQSYSMGQINDAIDRVSEALSGPTEQANITKLSGGMTFGGGVRVDFTPTWRASLEYERLNESTGHGNTIGSFQIKPSADVVLVGGSYFFPSQSTTRWGLGAGVGYYTFSGSAASTVTWYGSTASGSVDLGGSTVGFHGRGEVEVTLSPMWQLDGALGYRSAKGELEADGSKTGVDLDWSGLMTRVGITYVIK